MTPAASAMPVVRARPDGGSPVTGAVQKEKP